MPRNENERIQTEAGAAPPPQAAGACVRQAARAAQKCAAAARAPPRPKRKGKTRARRQIIKLCAHAGRASHLTKSPQFKIAQLRPAELAHN